MNVIRVPQLAWDETRELTLQLPHTWQVEVCNMAGYNRPALNQDEIQTAVKNPIGTPPIRELVRGKKEVVIIFDDMTRVTHVKDIVPSVLKELAQAGVPDKNIRFIMALGTHAARDRRDFSKKLGEDILARFPVYNHNAFANCTYVGTTTTYGTNVYINEEVMKCDFKIAIGSIVPHPMTGFSGGSKIIMPGVSCFEAIEHNHKIFYTTVRGPKPHVAGMGIVNKENTLRTDNDEAATLAGLDMLINCIVNTWGQTVAVFAGAMKPAYAAAVEEAQKQYLTPTMVGQDITIANTFAKANEAFIGLGIAYPALNPESGDAVLIANIPEGQVTHYLLGPFGESTWAPLRQQPRMPGHINRLIVYTEYPDLQCRPWFEDSDRVVFLHEWKSVMQLLQETHGIDSKVVVYPNSDIQYCL